MKQISSLLAAVVLLLLCGGCGQESDPLKWTREKAEQGDAEAQYELGLRHLWDSVYSQRRGLLRYSKVVPADRVEAAKWFRKAAGQGHAKAQGNLGWMCYYGDGVPKDKVEAFKWHGKAAKQGHAITQHDLGWKPHNRDGVPKDYVEAVKQHGAAEQGHADAQFRLGWMYAKGQSGLPQDGVEAAKWYRKAAEQGYAKAQYWLGHMYAEGEGVPKNFIESYAWFLLAKANGAEEASQMISLLEKHLTAEQMEKGQARAAELHRLIKQKSAK